MLIFFLSIIGIGLAIVASCWLADKMTEQKVTGLPENWGKIKTENGFFGFDDEDLDYNPTRIEQAKKNLEGELKEKLYWIVNADLTIGRTPFSKKLKDVGLLFENRATARQYRNNLKANLWKIKHSPISLSNTKDE